MLRIRNFIRRRRERGPRAGSTIVDLHSPSPFGCLQLRSEWIALLLSAWRNRPGHSAARWHSVCDWLLYQRRQRRGTHRDLLTKLRVGRLVRTFLMATTPEIPSRHFCPMAMCWWKAAFASYEFDGTKLTNRAINSRQLNASADRPGFGRRSGSLYFCREPIRRRGPRRSPLFPPL